MRKLNKNAYSTIVSSVRRNARMDIDMKVFSNKKKLRSYKEFLYILPFIILVAVFSYYPLYGWVYAFFDYRPPFPLSMDFFVGLKWF